MDNRVELMLLEKKLEFLDELGTGILHRKDVGLLKIDRFTFQLPQPSRQDVIFKDRSDIWTADPGN
ncbi:hypothetical protein D3C79_1054250 [compost metagenome]